MRVHVTSANAPTSLEYGASDDTVFLVPSVWRVRIFCIYLFLLLLLVVVFNVVIGLCGCLFVCFFSWWIKVKFNERSWQVLAWWCHGDDWRG